MGEETLVRLGSQIIDTPNNDLGAWSNGSLSSLGHCHEDTIREGTLCSSFLEQVRIGVDRLFLKKKKTTTTKHRTRRPKQGWSCFES